MHECTRYRFREPTPKDQSNSRNLASSPSDSVTHREPGLRDEVVDGLEYVAGVHVVVVGVAVAGVARLHVHQHRLHRQRRNLIRRKADSH